jgi:hypothetical protein
VPGFRARVKEWEVRVVGIHFDLFDMHF